MRANVKVRAGATLCAAAVSAGLLCAQNDVALHNAEAGNGYVLSNPSVGHPAGTFPPDFAGDCYWKILPGDRVLAYADADGATMTLSGLVEHFADTDTTTPSWFYDFMIGPALPSLTHPGALEPAFFQQGLSSEIFISLGPTGLDDPCLWYEPPSCDTPSCPFGFLAWWLWDFRFDPAIPVPSDGTPASDLAITWFIPGGMTMGAPSGSCYGGDYVLQGVAWTAETQADDLSGISALSGYQLAGAGRTPSPVTEVVSGEATFAERILNVIADSGAGFERGTNGGGATNGLKLTVGGGTARISYEVRSAQDVGVPNQAFVAIALAPLALPGATVLGAQLLLAPDPLFAATSSASAAATGSVFSICGDADYLCGFSAFFGGEEGAADFESPSAASGGTPLHFPVPPGAAGIDLYSQGLVLHTSTLQAFSTNRVRTSLFP